MQQQSHPCYTTLCNPKPKCLDSENCELQLPIQLVYFNSQKGTNIFRTRLDYFWQNKSIVFYFMVLLQTFQYIMLDWRHVIKNYTDIRSEVPFGWESLLLKKSETWIQIQRYTEMMPFLPFGNPWGYRFQGAFGNSIQSTREVDKSAAFLYSWIFCCLILFTRPTLKVWIQPKVWTISSLLHYPLQS